LTTSHPRVAIQTSVASKARASMVMQSPLDRCPGAGVVVELAGSATSGRSIWKGAFMMRLPDRDLALETGTRNLALGRDCTRKRLHSEETALGKRLHSEETGTRKKLAPWPL
jgi:hypothetical protein